MILKNVEKKEDNTAVFQVETDAAEFEAAVNGAYLKNKKQISIPGFRKGKAPRAVVEGMYGPEVFYQEAMDDLAPKAFEFGTTAGELRVVGTPALKAVDITDEKTVVYDFEVTLYPIVKLGEYKGLSAPKDVTQVSEEEIDEEVEKVRKRNARMLTVEDRAAQEGDTVNIDFDGFLNGERFDGGKAESYSLELGSHSFVPGFEEQIVGMQVGEEKDLDVTFPESYTPELAGKAVVFKVKLNSITTPELPELDDEFAKDVSEFDTLAEYREDFRKKLQEKYDVQAENAFRSRIMKKACDNMEADVPDVMIQERAEAIVRDYAANFGMTDRSVPIEELTRMMGLDAETMNQAILPNAELQVRSDLLLEAIAKAEGIEPTAEDIEEYLKTVAESVKAEVEDLRKYFTEDFIRGEFVRQKANEILFDSAVVAEEEETAPAEEADAAEEKTEE